MQEIEVTSREDDFILVKSRKKRTSRRGAEIKQTFSSQVLNYTQNFGVVQNLLINDEKIIKNLKAAEMHLESSELFCSFIEEMNKCLESLDPHLPTPLITTKIVCYGLGNFSHCIRSRYQLGFLNLLRKSLGIQITEFYDPIFSKQEKEFLAKELNQLVLSENEEGKRAVEDLTIFYLPHCSHQLVNNIVYANWERKRLTNCILISNSFTRICDGMLPKDLFKSLNYIPRAFDLCKEYKFKEFQYLDIFNDQSIHSFPTSKLVKTTDSFWSDRDVPVYKESDFDFLRNDIPAHDDLGIEFFMSTTRL